MLHMFANVLRMCCIGLMINRKQKHIDVEWSVPKLKQHILFSYD